MKDDNTLDFLGNLDYKYLIDYDDREKILKCLSVCNIFYENGAHNIVFHIAWFKFKIWKNETDYCVTIINELEHTVIEILNDNLDKTIGELTEFFKCVKEDVYKKTGGISVV